MLSLAAKPLNTPVRQGLDIACGIAARPCEGDELKHWNDLLLEATTTRTRRVLKQRFDVVLRRLPHLGAQTHAWPMPALSLSMQSGRDRQLSLLAEGVAQSPALGNSRGGG
jgi:hypothetical protein